MIYQEPAEVRRRRERRGERHAQGICGEMASLCAACYSDELAAVSEWAAVQPDPRPGEDCHTYWTRIGGPFGDVWYRVARERGALPPRPASEYRGDTQKGVSR